MSTELPPENHEPIPLLGLGSSDVLGHNAPLLERLRLRWPDTPHHRDSLHREAADEIELLRASIKEVVNHWREFGPDHGFDECIERAAGRRGLGA